MLCEQVISVVEVVAQVAEVPAQAILSDCRQSEVVEARIIAIHILSQMGYSQQRLAKHFHKSTEGIRKILSLYDQRSSTNPLMLRLVKEVTNILSNNYQITVK